MPATGQDCSPESSAVAGLVPTAALVVGVAMIEERETLALESSITMAKTSCSSVVSRLSTLWSGLLGRWDGWDGGMRLVRGAGKAESRARDGGEVGRSRAAQRRAGASCETETHRETMVG